MEFDRSHFWKPEESRSRSHAARKLQDLSFRESEAEGGLQYVHNTNQHYSLSQQRQSLPIYHYRTSWKSCHAPDHILTTQTGKEILYMLEKYSVLVVVGETGSGKSTQIPQYLMEAGWTQGNRLVACTQPRRLAAQELAQRVAEEKNCAIGQEVGYSVRFEDRTTPGVTQIKFLTDGMAMREMMLDPLLSQYTVIMIDEAHERSLYTDIIIGLLKKVLKRRDDLKVIISSATLEAEKYHSFFNTRKGTDDSDSCAILSIPGRSFPIDVHYLEQPTSDYLRCMAESVMEIHRSGEPGDILCFLTGRYEIEVVCTLIEDLVSEDFQSARRGWKMVVLPLYSGLPVEAQRSVFETPARKTRKVIVSTNVAETSVTIPGIVYVIDCGFEKIRLYDAQTNMESLTVVGCSQSSLKQRAGRAGREQPGKVYRLFTESQFRELAYHAVPEIQRCNLSQVVMQLKAMGIDDILHFDFLSPPPPHNMTNALEMLYALKILDDNCKLTHFGNILVEFPLTPSLARVLIASGEFGCAEEILTIVAMLTVPTVWISPKELRGTADKMRMGFSVQEGDTLTLLNVYNQYQRAKNKPDWCKRNFVSQRILRKAEEVREQLKKYARRFQVPIHSSTNPEHICKALVCGLFANAAQMQPDGVTYKTVRGGHMLQLHPSSVLFKYPPPWVIFFEVIRTTKEYMRDVTAVQPEWLGTLAEHYYDYMARKPAN